MFECIQWETIIIDECQRPTISKQLVQIKMLHTHNWLLLVNGISKVCILFSFIGIFLFSFLLLLYFSVWECLFYWSTYAMLNIAGE